MHRVSLISYNSRKLNIHLEKTLDFGARLLENVKSAVRPLLH